MPAPQRVRIPHPSKIIPKVVVLVTALIIYLQLFWNAWHREKPPHPVRVSLAHAEKGLTGEEALHSGLILVSPLDAARTPRAVRFDFPLGSEHGALTYNARPFREADHLADDLNGIGGENSDLGDPVFAAGEGRVVYAANASEGWGKVIILEHRDANRRLFQTVYAHLATMTVVVGQTVSRGQPIGTVGTAEGKYLAHLHLEWRESTVVDAGTGYAPVPLDRESPESMLKAARGAPDALLNPSFDLLVEQSHPSRRPELKASAGGLEPAPAGKASAREPRQ